MKEKNLINFIHNECNELYKLLNKTNIFLFSNKELNKKYKKNNWKLLKEIIEMFRFRLMEIGISQKKDVNLFEITWIFNYVKEIIINIEDFLKTFNIDIKEIYFRNEYNEKYESFFKISDKNRTDVLNKSLHLKDKKNEIQIKSLNGIYNFILVIRDFLIHYNSKGYGYVMVDSFRKIKNTIIFCNRSNHNNYYDFEVSVKLPLVFLIDFLNFINKNKNILKKMNNKRNAYKIPKDLEIIDEIKNHLIRDYSKVKNSCIKNSINYYQLHYFYDAVGSSEKYKKIAIIMTKIACYHFIKNYYDDDFEEYIDRFHNEFYKIIKMKFSSKGSYAIEQMKTFPDIFKNIVGEKIYRNIMKRNSRAKLHQNMISSALDNIIKNDSSFLSNIEGYFYHCINKKIISFKAFLSLKGNIKQKNN